MQGAFKLIIGREADVKEISLLNNFYSQEFKNFKNNDLLALEYLSTGEHRWNRSLDPNKIAALGVVANAIMNTDEAIMRK